MPDLASEAAQPKAQRHLALDALRGIAVLLMVLSGTIPWGSLPDWMYHAQVPPPEMKFRPEVLGITWVDLVFPFFIFSMGAAIPLAYGRRIDRGDPWWSIAWAIVERAVGLLFFAVFVQHLRPSTLDGSMGSGALLLGLLAFAVLMAIFVQTPKRWPRWWRAALRVVGWAGALALLATFRTAGGDGFSWGRTDIIIAVLANLAFVGPVVWIATRRSPMARAMVIGFVAAFVLASTKGGLAARIWYFAPMGSLIDVSFQKYLLVLLPATYVGDLLSARDDGATEDAWRGWLLCLLGLLLQPLVVVGLHQRWLEATTGVALALAAAGCLPASRRAGQLGALALMGTAWLALGLLLEPFEEGIRKDPSNFSYYFTTTGLACWLLLSLSFLRRLDRRQAGLLALVGANPMMAYVAMNNFVDPILRLTGIEASIASLGWSPWAMAGYSAAKTTLMASLVAWASWKAVYWRA